MSTMRTNYRYRCVQCGKVTVRKTKKFRPKQWIASFCESTGKNVHLLLPAISEPARLLRKLKREGVI